MTAVIVHRPAGLIDGEGARDLRQALHVMRGRGTAQYDTPERAACGRRENVRYESAPVAGQRIGLVRGTGFGRVPLDNLARIEFFPAQGAGHLSSPHGALTVLQDTLRNRAKSFQVDHSFRDAPAFHEQESTKELAACAEKLSRRCVK